MKTRRTIRVLALALAATALMSVSSTSSAFIRLTDQNGNGLRWFSQPIPFTIHASGSDDFAAGDTSAFTAIRLAFDTWTHVDGASIAFSENTQAANMPKVHANDGVNLVFFDENNSSGLFNNAPYIIAITPIYYDGNAGIMDADIVFNGQDHQFATNLDATKFDVQSIATHEIGHLLGLDHTGILGATMVPYALPGDARLRSPERDDQCGVIANYPAQGSAALGSIVGQVIHDSTGAGLYSGHVVAVNVATGEPEASAFADANGNFTLEMLRSGAYQVFVEPLNGPANQSSLQRQGIQTGFRTMFFGGVASPATFTLEAGQRNLSIGTLRVPDLGSAFSVTGASPPAVRRGGTATVSLSGDGLVQGLTVAVTGGGVHLSEGSPSNQGPMLAGQSFQVTVDSNAARGLRNIYVYRGSGSSLEVAALPGGFEVEADAPQLQSVSPPQGNTTGGTPVTLSGTGFDAGARVLFGYAVAQSVVVNGQGSITAVTPANSVGQVPVKVINGEGQETVLAGGFTYAGVATISSVSPGQGPAAGGVTVTILGSQIASNAQVLFNSSAATSVVVSNQGTRLDCLAPAGVAGTTADVSVVNPGAGGGTATQRAAYRYIDPQVTRVSPGVGSSQGGTVVQVLGDGFSPGSRVDFGAQSATTVQFVSQNELRATTPPGELATVDVTVVTSDGLSTVARGAFQYLNGADPTISSLSPSHGPTGGGTVVRILGANFHNAQVYFGSTAAARVVAVSSTELDATAPPLAAGVVDVVVRDDTGLQATSFAGYTADAPASGIVGAGGGSGGGGGGGGCALGAPLGAADGAGALMPLLILLASLGILRRRARLAGGDGRG